jgi:capsular exopolysaccharide synthesis family protein
MSRIHEALKKAQQDRALQPPAENTTAPPDEQALAPMTAFATAAAVLPGTDPAARPRHTDPRPLTFEDLSQHCAVSHWKLDPQNLLPFGSSFHVPGTEELRTLRSKLYQLAEARSLKTVLIASALPSEGKTFIAGNLAQVMARQHQRKVLLIDSDLRRPRLHLSLGSALEPGLTDYLRGAADEYAVVQKGSVENLFLITGGTPVNNPSELITNGRLKSLVERMSPLFDWIILDSPPVLPVSDARLLASFCDGVVVVVRAGRTPYGLSLKACQEFAADQLVGIVLNGVSHSRSYMAYQYYGVGNQPTQNGRTFTA